jgi:hypothetical protein
MHGWLVGHNSGEKLCIHPSIADVLYLIVVSWLSKLINGGRLIYLLVCFSQMGREGLVSLWVWCWS